MIVYIATVEFRGGAITSMSKRFYNKTDARKWANKYYNAMINDELSNIKNIYVDEAYEDDYLKPEKNYYEGVPYDEN